MRVVWEPYFAEDIVAALGAAVARDLGMGAITRMWPDLRDRWNLMMHSLLLARRPSISPDREDSLARMCVVLAAYEAIARSGRASSLLMETSRIDTVLERVPATVVLDLLTLLDKFRGSSDQYLHPQSLVLNPTFTGAAIVGGADGDVILDSLIWDFKATLSPAKSSNNYWPYQVLGYGLLDLDDRYKLQGDGIYLVRQGAWISWSWPEMFELLGANPDIGIKQWRRMLVAEVGRHSLRPGSRSRAIW